MATPLGSLQVRARRANASGGHHRASDLGRDQTDALLQLYLSVGRALRRTVRSGGLGCPGRDVAFDGDPVGAFDGSEPGGHSGLAGGDGLAVAAAVGVFGEGFAVALDFADVGFSFVGVGGDGEQDGVRGGGVQDEAHGLAVGVPLG